MSEAFLYWREQILPTKHPRQNVVGSKRNRVRWSRKFGQGAKVYSTG
jgi:hypothetical protein